jgi:hypothetical protein
VADKFDLDAGRRGSPAVTSTASTVSASGSSLLPGGAFLRADEPRRATIVRAQLKVGGIVASKDERPVRRVRDVDGDVLNERGQQMVTSATVPPRPKTPPPPPPPSSGKQDTPSSQK